MYPAGFAVVLRRRFLTVEQMLPNYADEIIPSISYASSNTTPPRPNRHSYFIFHLLFIWQVVRFFPRLWQSAFYFRFV